MESAGSVVVIGGTSGLGKEVARFYAKRGREVVISGRDRARATTVASEIGGRTRGIGLDLARPAEIAGNLSEVGGVDYLVISAIERDQNTVREYDVTRAIRLATLKLVGYTEVVHALLPRLGEKSCVLLFGGLAKERPYPGSTTVSTVNGGITAMVRTMAIELAPIRVNALHPGVVGDSPYWIDKREMLERVKARTPTGRLVTMQNIVDACVALLENPAINGVDLYVDGGWVLL
jgi:NAD(P)-dependent dehydrogenase (short-subunit alcohol dehydrogenase family)